MKKLTGCLIALAMVLIGRAQDTYIISFRDKGTNPYAISNPAAYLSQRGLDRRTRYGIAIDSTDLPPTPRYIDSIRLAGAVTILNVSKWLNSVSIRTTDLAALAKINGFPFVKATTTIAPRLSQEQKRSRKFGSGIQAFEGSNEPPQLPFKTFGLTADFFNYGQSYNQVHIHNGEFLHNIGLRGQAMIIGILDAGFQNYLTVKAFDSVRTNGQILGVYDFMAKDSSVNEDDSHGMQCFSTIGSNVPGQLVGTAPKASFYLFRSENASTEFPIEEHNWVCAAERLDSAGGDLISSSLGYNTFDTPFETNDHTYAQMDGNSAVATIGADLAAKKGILVVNSAGNEGSTGWHFIAAPADGDSVMAVGAVNAMGIVAGFSSYGPSSDGRIKPDVASVGQATYLWHPSDVLSTNSGTSFAAPNMAGLAACLWQGFREFNNMKIIGALRNSGNMAAAPNDRVGYGIPDVKKATMVLLKEFSTASTTVSNCKTTISWTSKDMSAMKYEIERMLAGQTAYTKIGELNGSGNVFANHTYQFENPLTGVLAGTHSYRIRQIIDTAAASFYADYIDTVTISLAGNCTATAVDPVDPNNTALSLLPNPAQNEFTIRITTAAAVPDLLIRIFDSRGAEVFTAKKKQGQRYNQFYHSIFAAGLR